MNKRQFLASAAAASFTTLSVPAMAATPVRIGFIPVADFLACMIAKDQGFFEKNGLDATLVPMANQQVIISALVSGSAELGTTTPINVLQADEAGIALRVVAGTHVTPLNSLSIVAARTDSGIKQPADLVGKRLAVNGLAAIHHVVVSRWLRENGVDPKRVTFVEVTFPQMPDVLKSGQVDAVMTTDPFSRRIVDSGIGVPIGEPFKNTPDGTPPSLYAVGRKWADAHPDAVKAIQTALAQAVDFAKSNDAGARESLARWTKQPAPVIASTPMPNFETKVTAGQLQFWLDEAKKQGVLRGTADVGKLIAS